MRKSNKLKLQELSEVMPVLNEQELQHYVGGHGGGTQGSSSHDCWTSCYANLTYGSSGFALGTCSVTGGQSYVGGEVVVTGSGGSGGSSIPFYDGEFYGSEGSYTYYTHAPFNSSDSGSPSDSTNYIENTNTGVGAVFSVLEGTSGTARIGSNLHIYQETASGRVFFGNQYVVTKSIAYIGKIGGRVTTVIGFGFDMNDAYNKYNEGNYGAASAKAVIAGVKIGLLWVPFGWAISLGIAGVEIAAGDYLYGLLDNPSR